MKKQLLLAMSAMSAMAFGAAPDLNAPAQDLTRVFNNTQTGALQIKGTVSSVAPTAKYVIFSTPDGKAMEDQLILKNYVMRSTEKSMFTGVNNFVKVQKIVGGARKDLANETVTFKLINYDVPDKTGYSMAEKGSYNMIPYTLLAKSTLDGIAKQVTQANPTGSKVEYLVNNYGVIYRKDNDETYIPSGTIYFNHDKKGELKVVDGVKLSGRKEMKNAAELKAFETAFSGEKQFGNVWILATVK